jgi:hypothetical protein
MRLDPYFNIYQMNVATPVKQRISFIDGPWELSPDIFWVADNDTNGAMNGG